MSEYATFHRLDRLILRDHTKAALHFRRRSHNFNPARSPIFTREQLRTNARNCLSVAKHFKELLTEAGE